MTTSTSQRDRRAYGFDSGQDDWRPRALCRGTDPEAFVLSRVGGGLTDGNRAALVLCAQCPVRTECHEDWAVQPPHRRGGFIAGGVAWTGRKSGAGGTPRGLAKGGDRRSAAFREAGAA